MANEKVLRLASLLGAVSEGFAPSMYPSLAKLGQAGRQMAGQALMAEQQKKAAEAQEKKEKSSLLGTIGSIGGSVLGSFIPGVGPVVGSTLGSLAGGAAGQAAGGGGELSLSTLAGYGLNGAMAGMNQAATQRAEAIKNIQPLDPPMDNLDGGTAITPTATPTATPATPTAGNGLGGRMRGALESILSIYDPSRYAVAAPRWNPTTGRFEL